MVQNRRARVVVLTFSEFYHSLGFINITASFTSDFERIDTRTSSFNPDATMNGLAYIPHDSSRRERLPP